MHETLQREAYFPTFIHYIDLADGPRINGALVPQISAWRAKEPSGIERSNAKALGAWHSRNDIDREPALAPLVAEIVHPNALWTGAYHVQASAECGPIVFHDPRPQAHMVGPIYGAGTRPAPLWGEVIYQAIAGRLILFPSWLLHDVQPNLSPLDPLEGERISISFNIVQRPAHTA